MRYFLILFCLVSLIFGSNFKKRPLKTIPKVNSEKNQRKCSLSFEEEFSLIENINSLRVSINSISAASSCSSLDFRFIYATKDEIFEIINEAINNNDIETIKNLQKHDRLFPLRED